MDLKLHVLHISQIEIHAISNPVSSSRIKVTTQFFSRIGFSGSKSTRKINNPVDLTVFLKIGVLRGNSLYLEIVSGKSPETREFESRPKIAKSGKSLEKDIP